MSRHLPVHNLRGTLVPTGLDTAEVIRAIGSLALLFDNHDSHTEEAAIEAAAQGRAAFWNTATYHNAAARYFAELVNRMPISEALVAVGAVNGNGARSREFLLSCIIPLNIAARNAVEIERGLREVV